MRLESPQRIPVPLTPSPRRRRHLWSVVALAGASAVVLAVAGSALTSEPGPSPSAGSPGPSTIVSSSTLGSTGTGTGSPVSVFPFVPLWPFGSVADATAWQREALPGGHQPWRLDAGSTARSFTTDYLGYQELDQVTSVRVAGSEAWVGVGSIPLEGSGRTAAVLHLARIGDGAIATRPWEVVGSEDTRLTLTTPSYGSVTQSPLTVGGTITGVDETLDIQVRTLAGGLLARRTGLSVGGRTQPWTATLTVRPGSGGPATVAVSTGGHLRQVEGFALTGVLLRPAATPVVTLATVDAALASTVAHGRYVGSCSSVTVAPTGTATGGDAVCSVALAHTAVRALYRVGYWRTDAGYYVILERTAAGRWWVVAANVAGRDVPPDLGGPLPSGD